MSYVKLEFELSNDLHELFIAELMDLDFYGFEQFDNRLVAYVEKARFNDSNREFIEQLLSAYSGDSLVETEEISEQNWNETWEQTVQPQRIGRFLVKPTWSNETPRDDEHLLEIDPKMSFGTGYHATTRLMLEQLQELDLADKTVLDAGTGTGILAIAAAKLGAKKAVGFDSDPWSRDNATENVLLNRVESFVEIRFGGIEQIKKDEMFDITLANINRNVIIGIFSSLLDHTKEGGTICLSGLLEDDEDAVREMLEEYPVNVTDIRQEEEWILMNVLKTGR